MPAALYLYNIEHWEIRNLDISNQGPTRQAKRAGVYLLIEDIRHRASHRVKRPGYP
jgi:hypothetical protein